jgi:GTP-binding protein EngB required for normal cell division
MLYIYPDIDLPPMHPKKHIRSWKHIIPAYLRKSYLHKAICLFDNDHGLKCRDRMLLKILNDMHKQYILVAIKSDKKNIQEKTSRHICQNFLNNI